MIRLIIHEIKQTLITSCATLGLRNRQNWYLSRNDFKIKYYCLFEVDDKVENVKISSGGKLSACSWCEINSALMVGGEKAVSR